jgi:hypothetical protein
VNEFSRQETKKKQLANDLLNQMNEAKNKKEREKREREEEDLKLE